MKCSRKETDCFGLGAGHSCTVLTDTDFGRPCPFYKPNEYDYDAYIDEPKVLDYPGRWKAVPGFEGLYLISDRGQVLNRWRNLITPRMSKSGRPFVQLIKQGCEIRRYIEDLVADSFLGGDGAIYHKDGDLTNNTVDNLRRKAGK